MCFADFFSESLFPRQVAQIQTRQFGRLVAGTKDFFLTNSAVSTKRTFAVTCSSALLAMYLSVLILLSYSWDLRDCNV